MKTLLKSFLTLAVIEAVIISAFVLSAHADARFTKDDSDPTIAIKTETVTTQVSLDDLKNKRESFAGIVADLDRQISAAEDAGVLTKAQKVAADAQAISGGDNQVHG